MIKVRVLKSFAGINFSHSAGDVIEIGDDNDWLKAGFVELVEDKKPARKTKTKKATTSK